jgi:SAM-dependent methyltransferase
VAVREPELPDHVLRNRAAWDGLAAEFEAPGHENWAAAEPSWGIWGIPESEAHVLPDVAGLDTIELGCGTGYVSAWLARRGARPVSIDNSPAQLENARRFQSEFGLQFPLLLGNAESVPLPTRASTWRSPSTAPASGATRIGGSRRRLASCAPADGSSFS